MCACIYEATIPDGRYLAHGWKVFPVTFVLIHSVNPKNIGGELVCEFSKRQTNDDVNEIKFISFFLPFASQVCTRFYSGSRF